MSSAEKGDIKINIKNVFTFKEIDNNIAIITSEGTVKSDSSGSTFMSFNSVNTDLTGKQKGEFEVEMTTGMLRSFKQQTFIVGNIEALGRVIPLKISTKIQIEGLKE